MVPSTESNGPALVEIADLKERIDFRQTFTARGEMFRESERDLPGIEKWLSTEAYITRRKWLFYVALFSSTMAILIITYAILV